MVRPFPVGYHKAERDSPDSIIKTNVKHKQHKSIHKRNTALEQSLKHYWGEEGLNTFNGTNLTNLPKLTDNASKLLEVNIALPQLTKALNINNIIYIKKNNSLGTDGFSSEF